MKPNTSFARARAFSCGLLATLALLSCGGSEPQGPGGAQPANSALGREVSDSAARLAAAAKVDWAAVTDWTQEQRSVFLEYAHSQFTEAQKAGKSYFDRMAEVAEEQRPEARKALETYLQKAQDMRMEIFHASENIKDASAENFGQRREAISRARAELFIAFNELKRYFSS